MSTTTTTTGEEREREAKKGKEGSRGGTLIDSTSFGRCCQLPSMTIVGCWSGALLVGCHKGNMKGKRGER